MSYLTFPRLHFSGQFKAYPATINNVPSNYEPSVYPNIEDIQLVWAPRGTGEITPVGCTVTMVEYEDGTSASTPEEDPIIGQPFIAMPNPGFIAGALVDLDPDQQGVSEIWGMKIQIGDNDTYIRGDFAPAAFNSIWKNVQGPNTTNASPYFSVTYQSALLNLETNGLSGKSRFLEYFDQNPAEKLSINFMIDAHNNNPVIYYFNESTFESLEAAGVSEEIRGKIKPMQKLKIQSGDPKILGEIPTKDFVTYQLQQYLNTEEYNSNIDVILGITKEKKYQPSTPYDFSFGFICGTVGTSSAEAPDYFVPSRILTTYNNKQTVNKQQSPYFGLVNFAPFSIGEDGRRISINLSNSLPVKSPGVVFYKEKIGDLRLVYFSEGVISVANANTIATIPYMEEGFLTKNGGMFTTSAAIDLSTTPLGIISTMSNGTQVILLAENKDGYYLRANQYVFRMNPGVESTPENPRGETATVEIHALKFGAPVEDGTQIIMSTLSQSGIGVPEKALTVSPEPSIVKTNNGLATFTFTASDPRNPRGYIDGQIYFKSYGFADPSIANSYVQDSTDFISVQVYNQHAHREAIDILNKYGYLYKIMSFLTDDDTVKGIDMRNMVKNLLQKPFSDIRHMPITRDLSMANRQKIIDWIDQLNQS